MPYGGEDEAKRKHFTGVFQSIIAQAATIAGYEPKRSDIAGEPGNITHDIIRDLADSDIVIADLTDANANVFFELGIRHAFRKSGTVHVVDAAHEIPFDVRQYRAIEYSTQLADIPDVVKKIAAAIRKREEQPDRADNPVHDALPELPLNIKETGDVFIKQQLTTVQSSNELLRKENEQLTDRISELSPGDVSQTPDDIDVDGLLDRADEIAKSTGQHAILRLRQAMEENGPDAFAKELRTVLKSRYLDENDFIEIMLVCKQSGLQEHRRAILEVAVRRHPDSERIFLAHVDALDDSPNPRDREREKALIENRMGVVYRDGMPRLPVTKSDLPLHEGLAALFNLYTKINKFDWVLSVADSLPQAVQKDPLVFRQRARALARLGRVDEAQEMYKKVINTYPSDASTLAFYANFLDDQDKGVEAYEVSENAILANPEDGRLFLALAARVFNNGYYRNQQGEIVGPLPRNSREKVAIPLVMKGIERPTVELVEEAVRFLVRGGAIREAQAVASGKRPEGRFDTSAVDYLAKAVAEATQKEDSYLQTTGEQSPPSNDGPVTSSGDSEAIPGSSLAG
jgi:tetratricopeptide (TPR) repeat protein